jgi:hypothetical protein
MSFTDLGLFPDTSIDAPLDGSAAVARPITEVSLAVEVAVLEAVDRFVDDVTCLLREPGTVDGSLADAPPPAVVSVLLSVSTGSLR